MHLQSYDLVADLIANWLICLKNWTNRTTSLSDIHSDITVARVLHIEDTLSVTNEILCGFVRWNILMHSLDNSDTDCPI